MKSREITVLQETAARQQAELGRLVSQSSELLEDIGDYASERDRQSMKLLSARLRFQIRSYEELYAKMNVTSAKLEAYHKGKNTEEKNRVPEDSVYATAAMLRQMMVQAQIEMKHLIAVSEETELACRAAETEGPTEQLALLEKLQRALKESKEEHG